MKQRIMLGVLVAACASAPAFAQDHNNNDTNTSAQSVQGVFKTLAGEWDGQVITSNNGKTSSSQVNASNRVENNGESFASCFQGFSFGQPFQGGSVYSCQNGKFNVAWTDTICNETSRGTYKATAHGFVFNFERTDTKTGKTTKFEQVTTIVNNDNYTVECWSVEPNGRKREVMVLDMNRLPSGQKSQAWANFESSPTLAKARQAVANSAQANVNDSH